jgi:hypothetical protein
MMMKTRMFIAKSFAKKHYKGAMDAMKSLKGKIKKPTGFKAKAMAAGSKIKTFASKNKTALKVAGGSAVAGGAAGAYVGSKKTRNKISFQAGQGVGSGYLLGKQSKVKGKFQLDIAPKFNVVAESKSKINKITVHKSNKEFLKAIKTKNFKGAVLNRKKPKQ